MWYSFNLGRLVHEGDVAALEQHDLCYDTASYEAWVAKKGKELRCFMEYKQYPHRVRASYIDNDLN
jgi:hypothetical protein